MSWDDVVRSTVVASSEWGPHSLHTAEVTGSIPVTPTIHFRRPAGVWPIVYPTNCPGSAFLGHAWDTLGVPQSVCESGSCFPLWLRLLADSLGTRLRVLGDGGSGRCVTVAG
jgi:hypothetical protein